MRRFRGILLRGALLQAMWLPIVLPAQQSGADQGMPGMKMDAPEQAPAKPMPGMDMSSKAMPEMQPKSFIEAIDQHTSSGTSAEPNSTPIPMLMSSKGS